MLKNIYRTYIHNNVIKKKILTKSDMLNIAFDEFWKLMYVMLTLMFLYYQLDAKAYNLIAKILSDVHVILVLVNS